MSGGELDLKSNLRESFLKIKEDISRLNEEILQLKKEYKEVLSENIELRKKNISDPVPGPAAAADADYIRRIVLETIKTVSPARKENSVEQHFLRKINRNRKMLIRNRILEVAAMKSMSLPEVKEIIVEQEQLCSKATFYRYIEKFAEKRMIDLTRLDDRVLVVKI